MIFSKHVHTQSISSQDLPATGERFLPEQMSGDIELEHLHRYAIALGYADGKSVLDIASGEGYGSNLLAQVANSVVGVDISNEAISHSRHSYPRTNLEFRQGSCSCIPVGDHTIDLAVSFETLEHHDQHLEMLSELKRVLKPDGVLIISTPNKREYTDLSGQENHYHIKELYLEQFTQLLSMYFSCQMMLGQRICHASIISSISSIYSDIYTFSGDARAIKIKSNISVPVYYIAIASDRVVDYKSLSFFDGTKSFSKAYKVAMETSKMALDQVAQRDFEIARIKSTFSWQLTKPLRFIWNAMTQIISPK